MCVSRVIVKSLWVAAANFSVPPNLQLHGQLPILHPYISTTWPQYPLSLCMLTSFLSPWGHGFLFSVSCPPPYNPHPSNHSHCLSGSHGPPTKSVGGEQWNNSWHPYGLHFPDRIAVTVLLCVSICVTEQGKENKERTKGLGERDGTAK